MGKNDREIWVGDNGNRMYYDNENNIVIDILIGNIDQENARERIKAMKEFAEAVDGKIKLLADVNKCGIPSAEARRFVLNTLNNYEKLGKHAIYGLHPVARVIASFLMGIARKKDMRFFSNREEALAWLKE